MLPVIVIHEAIERCGPVCQGADDGKTGTTFARRIGKVSENRTLHLCLDAIPAFCSALSPIHSGPLWHEQALCVPCFLYN